MDVQRKRDIIYSCRLTAAERKFCDQLKSDLGACTTRETLLAAYLLAASNLDATRAKILDVATIDDQGGDKND